MNELEHDDFDDIPTKDMSKKGGVVLAEDDLSVGDLVCVYNFKLTPESAEPIMGQSLQIKAVLLPYVVAEVCADPQKTIITLDVRFLNFMRVNKEYVLAQKGITRKKKEI